MLKFYNYDIVCQEIPDEITLAVNITNCPNHCHGCHSPWLWEDVGTELTKENLEQIIKTYESAITCVCFMGGDREPQEVDLLAQFIHEKWPSVNVGWYSGRKEISKDISIKNFQYIKTGAYIESLGGLKSPTTNQKMLRILPNGDTEDIQFYK